MKKLIANIIKVINRLLLKNNLFITSGMRRVVRDISWFNIWDYYRDSSLDLVSKIILENNIKGECAELGVYKGEFAKKINKVFPEKKLYLFDTFVLTAPHSLYNKKLKVAIFLYI